MAASCVNPEPGRRKYGLSNATIDAIKRRLGGRNITTEEARNVVRNLGVDDIRALDVTKEGSTRRVLGRNIKEIEEWTPGRGEIPSQTIVKVRNADGMERFYLSRQKTNLTPTRWIHSNGRIKPNPDWDAVGENITLKNGGVPEEYVRLPDNTYRLAREGEQGVYLNIQNPYKGSSLSDNRILELDVDAFEVAPGRYRLVDEGSQVIEPDKAINRQSRDALVKEAQENTPSRRELLDTIQEASFNRPIAMGMVGGLAGGMMDEDGTTGAYLGGAVGMMLGSRRMRNHVTGYFSGRKGKTIEEQAIEIEAKETARQENIELAQEGYAGRMDDPEEKAWFKEKVMKPLQRIREEGGGIHEWMKNGILSSGYSVFKGMKGSRTADWLLGVLENSSAAPQNMFRRYSERIVEQFGERGWDEARAQQINTIRNMEGYERLTEDEALEKFGESMFRIITYKGNVEDGRYVWDSAIGGDKAYQNAEFLRADEMIARSEAGQKMKKVLNDTFNDIADLQTETLRQQINRYINIAADESVDGGTFNSQLRQDLKQLLQHEKLSYRQFMDSTNDLALKERLHRAYAEGPEEMKKVVELHNRKSSIENMRGRYFPQIFSSDKMARDYRQFVNNRGIGDLPRNDRNLQYWADRGMNMADLHHNAERLLKNTDDGMDVEAMTFSSRREAIQKFRDIHVNKIVDDEIRNRVIRDLDSNTPSNIERYLEEETLSDGSKAYYLKNPNEFSEEGINIMRDINAPHFESATNIYYGGTQLKMSNHLDRARQTIMPAHMIETNIEQVIRRYANDVAPRLHFMKHNLATKSDFDRIKRKIAQEVGDRITPTQMQKGMGRMETWWNISQNGNDFIPVGMTPQQRAERFRKRSTTSKLLQGISNYATGGFIYFTSFYAIAQPLLVAPFYGNWRQTKAAYKEIFTNPQSLRRMTDEFQKMGIFDKTQRGTFNVSMEDGMLKDMMPNSDHSFLDSFYRHSETVANIGMNFSLTKSILKNTNIDLENLGILRVLGGNLMDISGAEAGIGTMAMLRHVETLVDAATQLRQQGGGQVQIGRQVYRQGSIDRQLRELGVSDPERFVESKAQLNEYLKYLKGEDVNLREAFDNEGDYLKFYDEITTVMNTFVDQYHGRSRLSRPERWIDNPYGRALSRFSSYAQNFGVRIVRQRMYQPLKDWTETYRGGSVDDTSLFTIAYHMSQNNEGKLREIFGTRQAFEKVTKNKDLAEKFYNSVRRRDDFVDSLPEADQLRWNEAMNDSSFSEFVDSMDNYIGAYNDFPAEAVHNMFKVLPALGVSKAMLMTRAAVVDILGMATNEALGNDDYEAWRALNRQMILNPQSKPEDQKTFGDLFSDDVTGYDLFQLFKHGLYLASDTGFAGRIPQLFMEETRYPGSGMLSHTPVTSAADEIWQLAGRAMSKDSWSDFTETAPRDLTDRVLLHTPIIGSFHDVRQGLINSVWNKPKNRGRLSNVESVTGETIDNLRAFDF